MAGAEKVHKAGIKRENDLMYYVKNGDIWAVPRKKPGEPKGKAQRLVQAGIQMDYGKYLYFVDGDGDIARKERQVGGSKRKKAAAPKKAAAKKAPAKKAPAKKAAKKAPAKKAAKKPAKKMAKKK